MLRQPLLHLALLCLLLSGCSTVYLSEPIGEAPLVLSPEEWDGTWVHKEGAVTIKVVDAAGGRLLVGWVEPRPEGLKYFHYELVLYRAGEWTLANLLGGEGGARYLWSRVERNANQIIVWTPDKAQLQRLVTEGVLPGRVEDKGDVILEPLTSEQLRVITSGSHGVVVDWQEPLHFTRISR